MLCCLPVAGGAVLWSCGACPAWDDAACAKCTFVYALRMRASSVSWLWMGVALGRYRVSPMLQVLRSPPPSHPLDLSHKPPPHYIYHHNCTGERSSTHFSVSPEPAPSPRRQARLWPACPSPPASPPPPPPTRLTDTKARCWCAKLYMAQAWLLLVWALSQAVVGGTAFMLRQKDAGLCRSRCMTTGRQSSSRAFSDRQASARLRMKATTEDALPQPSSSPSRRGPVIIGVNKYSHVSNNKSHS